MSKILNDKGLTLIEIIVTLAVLGVVVTPLMNMFITSQKINNVGKEEYVTLQIAQKHLENIKSAKKIGTLLTLGYMNIGGDYYSTPHPDEDLPYEVSVKITPESSMSYVSNKPDELLPIVTIYNNSVEWKYGASPIESQFIEDGIVDITIEGTKITVSGQPHAVASSDINVVLETDEAVEAKMNFIDCSTSGKIYLVDNHKDWSFEVFGGEIPQIINVLELPADEVLYRINVEIYKGSGADKELVKSLESTNIFK